jgi:hypothetical protein
MTMDAASLGIQPWDRGTETFTDWMKRRDKAVADQRNERRSRELFRLALVNLPLKRYAVGVEFGMDAENAEPGVHAYVACKECYRKFPGMVEPRALVMDDKIKKLFPDNEVLAVGADMMVVIGAMMDHERTVHGGRPH